MIDLSLTALFTAGLAIAAPLASAGGSLDPVPSESSTVADGDVGRLQREIVIERQENLLRSDSTDALLAAAMFKSSLRSDDESELARRSSAALDRAIVQAPDDALLRWVRLEAGCGAANERCDRAAEIRRLVELDADNGFVWLASLDDAQDRHDSDAAAFALHHVALAHRFDDFRMRIEQRTMRALVALAPTSRERQLVAMARPGLFSIDAVRVGAAKWSTFEFGSAPLRALMSACHPEYGAVIDAVRASDCRAAARLLIESHITDSGWSYGMKIATALADDGEERHRLGEEVGRRQRIYFAYLELEQELVADPKELSPWIKRWLAATNDYDFELAELRRAERDDAPSGR